MPFEDREVRDLEAICGLSQTYLGTGISQKIQKCIITAYPPGVEKVKGMGFYVIPGNYNNVGNK